MPGKNLSFLHIFSTSVLFNILSFFPCSLGLDVFKLSYRDFLDRITGPRVSSRSVVASPVSASMMSSVTGDNIENLSPERTLQKVRELVTNSLDTLSKVKSTD